MNFLCDTNVLSEVMKPQGSDLVIEWFSSQEVVRLSVVAVEEVHWGLTYKDARKQLAWFERFLELRAEVLDVTPAIATRCGVLRGQMRKRGIIGTQADMLVAATAAVHSLILVTRNIRDFEDCGVPLFNPFP